MSDYHEWLEASAGTIDECLDGYDLNEERVYLSGWDGRERDAVLCLVDCREEMFKFFSEVTDPVSMAESSNGQVLSRCERSFSLPNELREMSISDRFASPFSHAMSCVLKLYREKVVERGMDMVGLIFYNTNVMCNIYDFPGVYVFHTFDILDAQRVHEVSNLVAAGNADSSAYFNFKERIGHAKRHGDSVFSDALWAAHHMCLQLCYPSVEFRRVFVFTNDADPSSGDLVILRQCLTQVTNLYEDGVAFGLFLLGGGLPMGTDCAKHTASCTSKNIKLSSCATYPISNCLSEGDSFFQGAYRKSGVDIVFSECAFWDCLLRVSVAQYPELVGGRSSRGLSPTESFPYCGKMYDCRQGYSFESLLSAVRKTVHPPRHAMNCAMRLGWRSDGGMVPTMHVSVWNPVIPTLPQKVKSVKRARNVVPFGGPTEGNLLAYSHKKLRREVNPAGAPRVVANGVAGQSQTHHTFLVGGRHVVIADAERSHMVKDVVSLAGLGLTILCFKKCEDISFFEHSVKVSPFLHPNIRVGGHASLLLFANLVRVLRNENKVAIAVYVMRRNSPPRMVALIPSLCSPTPCSCNTHGPLPRLPAEGLGLYVVFLPYADELRPLPYLPLAPPEHDTTGKASTLAMDMVDLLTIHYDIDAESNLTFQPFYKSLEVLGVRCGSEACDNVMGVPKTETACEESPLQGSTQAQCKEASLEVLRDFKAVVFGDNYSAEVVCARRVSSRRLQRTRRPRAKSNDSTTCTRD